MKQLEQFIYLFFTVVLIVKVKVIGSNTIVHAKEGKIAILICPGEVDDGKVTWLGPPRFQAFAYGMKINTNLSQRRRLSVFGNYSRGEFGLQILNVSRSDEGLYRCTTIYKKKANQYDMKLLLAKPPMKLKITNSNGKLLHGREGELLVLECKVFDGEPAAHFSLTRDGAEIVENVDKGFTWMGNNSFIYLRYSFVPHRENHLAYLTCSANNIALDEPITDTIQLDISYEPHITIFAYPSPNVTEGLNISLVCESDANPNVENYSWYHNEFPKQLIGRTKRLYLVDVNRTIAGNYTCIGKNNLAEGTDEIHVNVLYPPSVNIKVIPLPHGKKLQCAPNGFPEVYYFLQWEQKSSFGEHVRFIEGNLHNGTITLENKTSEINYQNNGMYVCKVENGISDAFGQLVQNATIEIKTKGKPIFVSDNKNVQYGIKGQSASLTVYIHSHPKYENLCCSTGKWKMCHKTRIDIFEEKNTVARDIIYGTEILVNGYKVEFETAVLKVPDFTLYTFEASNEFGTSKFIVKLIQDGNVIDDSFKPKAKKKEPEVYLTFLSFGLIVSAFVIILVASNICNCLIQKRIRSNKTHTQTQIDVLPREPEISREGQYEDIEVETEMHLENNTSASNISTSLPTSTNINRSLTIETNINMSLSTPSNTNRSLLRSSNINMSCLAETAQITSDTKNCSDSSHNSSISDYSEKSNDCVSNETHYLNPYNVLHQNENTKREHSYKDIGSSVTLVKPDLEQEVEAEYQCITRM